MFITVYFMVIFFVSCRKAKLQGIKFINNTNRYLTVYDAFTYPDTSMSSITWGGYIINPTSEEVLNSKNGWVKDIKHYNSSNTLMLFVVYRDTLAKYGFDSVASSYNIAKRYDLTLDNLENMGWTVFFP